MHFLTIDDRGLILNEADIRLHVSGEYGETAGEKMNMAECQMIIITQHYAKYVIINLM